MNFNFLPSRVAQQTALVAHVNIEGITGNHQTFQKQHTGSVSDQTITFHFTESQTTLASSALGRLPGQHGSRTACSGVHLVQNHVLQFLVINLST